MRTTYRGKRIFPESNSIKIIFWKYLLNLIAGIKNLN
jgi:hypothetical protein